MATDGRLEELWTKIDGFFARVRARYPGELACGAGCDECCKRQLTVTGVEAEAIEAGISGMDSRARSAMAHRARSPAGSACPALEGDGRCGIYAVRPVVCRSHGLPIRFVPEASTGTRRALPIVDACGKNFIQRDLSAIDGDCVLDQSTLSTLLAALDAAHADAGGRPRGTRFTLAAILSAGADE